MAAGNAWTALGNFRRSVRVVCNEGTEAPPVPAKATVTVAFSAAAAGNTVTLKGVVFTAIANGATPATAQEFPVGAGGSANTETGAAFVAALARTVGMHGCTGVNATGTVTVTAGVYGTAGHHGITKVGAPITLGAAALAGGVSPVGVNLSDVGAVIVKARATTSNATLAGGKWIWYHWDEDSGSGVYLPITAMDDTCPAAAQRGYTLVGPSAGFGSPIMLSSGYLIALPSGVTISAGTITAEFLAFEAGPGQVGRLI